MIVIKLFYIYTRQIFFQFTFNIFVLLFLINPEW